MPASMTFDLHIHTSRYSPDSVIDPFQLVRRAVELGLSGIVITEHDALWSEEELDELRAAAPELVVLGGCEVSGRQGHVLVYGISDLTKLAPGVGWAELCDEVHRQGGVAVAAHPNRFGQDFDACLARTCAQLDGIEVMSKNMDHELRHRTAQILKANPLFTTLGNSDAHEIHQLATCVTDFDAEIRNSGDLVAAIRERKTTPRPGK